MNWWALFWLAMFMIFLLLEASTTAILSIWFAAGALVAMLVSLFVENGWILTVVFLAVSIALLLLCRSVVRKYFPKKIVATNVDSVIGTTGCVTASIDNLAATGQIKLGAMYWTARSTDNTIIPEGTVVRVDRVEGVKVFVSPVEIPVK